MRKHFVVTRFTAAVLDVLLIGGAILVPKSFLESVAVIFFAVVMSALVGLLTFIVLEPSRVKSGA